MKPNWLQGQTHRWMYKMICYSFMLCIHVSQSSPARVSHPIISRKRCYGSRLFNLRLSGINLTLFFKLTYPSTSRGQVSARNHDVMTSGYVRAMRLSVELRNQTLLFRIAHCYVHSALIGPQDFWGSFNILSSLHQLRNNTSSALQTHKLQQNWSHLRLFGCLQKELE